MAKQKRGVFERKRDYERTTELYLKGWRQVDIAKEMGVSQQQISSDLQVIQKKWAEQSINSMNEIKMRELDRIDTLEREYWKSWDISRGKKQMDELPSEKPKIRKKRGRPVKMDDSDVMDQVADLLGETNTIDDNPLKPEKGLLVVTDNPHGDPRFLAGVQWCINRRCILLGLDTPSKAQANMGSQTIDALSDDEKKQRISMLIRRAKQENADAV